MTDNPDAATAMVTRLCPLAKLIDGSAGSLSFSIPPAALEALPELVEWIEDPTNQLNDWGITHTTLEEVFIRLARAPATATTEEPVAVPIKAAPVEDENPTVQVQVPAGTVPEGGDGGDGGGESKESGESKRGSEKESKPGSKVATSGTEVDVENPMTSSGDAPRSPLVRQDSAKQRDGLDGNPGGNASMEDLATDVPTRAKFGALFRLQMWQRKRRKCNSAFLFLCPTLTMVLLLILTLVFKVRVMLRVI